MDFSAWIISVGLVKKNSLLLFDVPDGILNCSSLDWTSRIYAMDLDKKYCAVQFQVVENKDLKFSCGAGSILKLRFYVNFFDIEETERKF